MRLRNLKNKDLIIEECEFLIKNPEDYKGEFKSLFSNNNPIHLEVGMGKGTFIYNMAKTFPEINFIKILGQRENVPIKPDPKIVFDIIQDTNIKPEEVLYVGDSDVDLQTAFNAKVDAVGVTWGFRTKSDLSNYQSLGLIDSTDELLHFIE
jgi:beta-phosphoglucomutase-like phosphatase (HAD superfamily)